MESPSGKRGTWGCDGEVRNEKKQLENKALALTLAAVCWLSGCSAHKEISVTAAETQEETRELSLNTETEVETQPEAESEERCEKDGKIQSYLTGNGPMSQRRTAVRLQS